MRRLLLSPLPELAPGPLGPDDVLLGPWCLDREGCSPDRTEGFALVPAPSTALADLEERNRYVGEACGLCLRAIAAFANQLHGVDHPVSFWKVICNTWLREWLAFSHDVWSRLEATRSLGPMDTLIFPSVDARYQSYMHALLHYRDHFFLGLHISDMVRNAESLSWIRAKEAPLPPGRSLDPADSDKVRGLRKALTAVPLSERVPRYLRRRARCSLAHVIGVSAKHELFLTLTSDPFCILRRPNAVRRDAAPVDPERVAATPLELEARNEFEALVGRILKKHLPGTLLRYEHHRFRRPCVVISSLDYTQRNREYFYAHLKEQGGRWIGVQHGCTYGMDRFPSPTTELEFVDEFITWGWDSSTPELTCHPLPSPQLAWIPGRDGQPRPDLLLVGSNISSLYTLRVDKRENAVQNLAPGLERCKEFLHALDAPAREAAVYRPFLGPDNQWDPVTPLRTAFPGLRVLSNRDLPFTQALETARVMVTDVFGTTYLQAMAMGIPCVLYHVPENNAYTPAFQATCAELERVGLLHASPRAAAECVNAAWNDVKAWWNEPQRTSVAAEFCRQWARRKDDWYLDWQRFMKQCVRQTREAA